MRSVAVVALHAAKQCDHCHKLEEAVIGNRVRHLGVKSLEMLEVSLVAGELLRDIRRTPTCATNPYT